MLRGLCEEKAVEALGMLPSREYLRKALSLSEKFTKQKRNAPTGRDGIQTA
jgi:hypothetical protein